MTNQKGFTLIELMVVVVIGLIVLTMIANAVGFATGNSSISFGINGATESRCIEGYKFIVDQNGNTRQILDEFGKGARCEKQSKPGGV
jgi:prepilin-type N-terminal cleavage/methylation domain-containing protein